MSTESTKTAETRKLKLGAIKYYQKVYRGSHISVKAGRYMGRASAMGGELIGDVSEAHGRTRKPAGLDLYESQTQPGDLVGVPVVALTPDSLPMTWSERGRRGMVDMGKLLTERQTVIPADTRLVIELYPDKDAELGDVVGFKMKGAQFLPKEIRKARKTTGKGKE
ncbi:MAG TPA: hypothetical protein VGK74_11975 [Symbiobacteriaceae bacterium]